MLFGGGGPYSRCKSAATAILSGLGNRLEKGISEEEEEGMVLLQAALRGQETMADLFEDLC